MGLLTVAVLSAGRGTCIWPLGGGCHAKLGGEFPWE